MKKVNLGAPAPAEPKQIGLDNLIHEIGFVGSGYERPGWGGFLKPPKTPAEIEAWAVECRRYFEEDQAALNAAFAAEHGFAEPERKAPDRPDDAIFELRRS